MRFFCSQVQRGSLSIFLTGLLLLLGACSTAATTTTTTRPAFHATAKTTDGLFTVDLNVSPDQLGNNTFMVNLTDTRNGGTVTNGKVQIFTTMLDMNMGTDSLNLTGNGKGSYEGQGELGMDGNWSIRVLIHTTDNQIHTATIHLTTPA